MQQNEEGEFYPEKFNYNYKIPKRKGEDMYSTIPPPPPPPAQQSTDAATAATNSAAAYAAYAAAYGTAAANAAAYGTTNTAAAYGTTNTAAAYGTTNAAAAYGTTNTAAAYGTTNTAAAYGTTAAGATGATYGAAKPANYGTANAASYGASATNAAAYGGTASSGSAGNYHIATYVNPSPAGYQTSGKTDTNQTKYSGTAALTTAYPTNYQQKSGYGQQQQQAGQNHGNSYQGYQGYQNSNQSYQGSSQGGGGFRGGSRNGGFRDGNRGGGGGGFDRGGSGGGRFDRGGGGSGGFDRGGGGDGGFNRGGSRGGGFDRGGNRGGRSDGGGRGRGSRGGGRGGGGYQRNNQERGGGRGSSYYDNYSYDPNAASAYYGQDYSSYGGNNPVDDGDPIKRNIFKALKGMQEKPKKKNFGKFVFETTVPDIVDSTLPKDLKDQFQPLFCKLCSAQLSSNAQAKLHYKSKNHEKKIKKWLIEYSEKTGEPLHPRAEPSAPGSKSKDQEAEKAANPSWFHCDICDLELTGKMHAESHYMGRNHQKVLMGHKKPTGNGYYDADGKWVRTKAAKSSSFNFENGEDNFGADFRKNESGDATDGGPPAKKKKKEPVDTTQYHCDVCNINTTCQEQLDTHYRGTKHAKKLKSLGLTNYAAQRELIDGLFKTPSDGTDTLTDLGLPKDASAELANEAPTVDLAAGKKETSSNVAGDIDLTSYRTPSGEYYCPTCNCTMNNDIPFMQHMKSKNHAKKVAANKK